VTASRGDDLHSYLRLRRQQIDAVLDRVLPVPPGCPARLAEAMRYSVFAGGKRFRPVLTLAAAEATALARPLQEGGRRIGGADAAIAAALPAACAIELIHTYSLIHDDLPAMDNDTMRRGRPTSHVVFGEGMAILAGDGLLTEAFVLLAREPAGDDPPLVARRIRTLGVIAAAAGAAGMAGGQAIDLGAVERGQGDEGEGARGFDADSLRHMHACKTGALLRAAAVSGAIMADGDEAAIAAIDAYAADLGLAFQIVDDILDVEGSSEDLGKTAGKDAAAGKPTYPALFGLGESKRLADESIARAVVSLEEAGLDRGRLGAIADWVVSRTR
jgi:geranylgeranyl diphosphate synthase, type II